MRQLRLSLLLCCGALCTACSHRVGASPAFATREALANYLAAQGTAARSLTAELRLTTFGPQGRLRGTATLWVKEPDKLRYELLGPHGGVLSAVACDGITLRALDLSSGHFKTAPATPAGFDELLGLPAVHLDASGWVRLLLGAWQPPAKSELQSLPDGSPHLVWQADGQTGQADLDAAPPYRLRRAVLRDATGAEARLEVEERDARGVPQKMTLQAPGHHVEVRLREVEADIELPDGAFILQTPQSRAF